MSNHKIHIEKVEQISKIADEILYLEKTKVELKQFANEFTSLITGNIDIITFFPEILNEIKTTFDKKNFTIANAKGIIDKTTKAIIKLNYIKSSYLAYANITDKELRAKTNLDSFTNYANNKKNSIRLAELDIFYKEVVDNYNLISNSNQHLGTVRSKYEKMKSIVAANNTLITEFPNYSKEINDFLNIQKQNEVLIDNYLNNINDSVVKLSEILNHINTFDKIPANDKKIFGQNLLVFFQNLKKDLNSTSLTKSYQDINTHYNYINQKITSLKQTKAKFNLAKNLLISNTNNLYKLDFDEFSREIFQIEQSLTTHLNQSFENQNQLIINLEVKINSSVNSYNTKNLLFNQLSNYLITNKNNYWSDDYNKLITTLNSLKSNGNTTFEKIETEVKQLATTKHLEIDNFINKNKYLLNSSNKLDYLLINFRNSFVSRKDYTEFINDFSKNIGFKMFLYKLKDTLMKFGNFLIMTKTLKTFGVLLVISLVALFVFSYWQQIIIVTIFIALIIGLFNRK